MESQQGERPPPNGTTWEGLRRDAAAKEKRLRKFLACWPPRYWWPMRNPERVKALDRTASRLAELQRYLELDTGTRERQALASTRDLVAEVTPWTKRDPAWDMAEQLKLQLLWFRPDAELAALLRIEQSNPPASRGGWTPLRSVDRLYDGLEELAKEVERGFAGARERAVAVLAELHRQNVEKVWHDRANSALRARQLKLVSVLLLVPLVVLVLFALNALIPDRLEGGPEDTLLELLLIATFKEPLIGALMAGALGAMLSGLFKLRDTPLRIGELRHFGSVLIAQFLVGATAALIIYILFRSNLLQVGNLRLDNENWGLAMVLGFLAGFSEPFLLGSINKFLKSTGVDTGKDSSESKKTEAKG